MNRLSVTWVTALLAIWVLSTQTAAAAEAPHCDTSSSVALLREFYALPTGDASTPPADLHAALERDRAEVSLLLATVPEPRLGFDGTVEAITAALGEAGHTLARYTLPWAAGKDRDSSACGTEQPGRALFLRSLPDGRRSLLFLYLVGESPTAGINRRAFLNALDDINALRDQLPLAKCVSCNPLRLLAPAFSGSVASLEQLLEQPAALRTSMVILSGRATDASVQTVLEAHSRPERTVLYQATVIPDDALQREFYCYLTETLGAQDHEIAILVESSTRYGRSAVEWHRSAHRESSPGSRRVSRIESSSPVLAGTRCKRAHHPRLLLPMPLHIARLHAAWRQQDKGKATDTRASTDVPTSGMLKALSPPLDVSERSDVIPSLSPTTLASTDRALATLLSSLSSEKVRYVGLFFTDPQDKLFLAEQVRRYAPDTVLFTFESDLSYAHPDSLALLKGMLVVSPYPLFVRNQQWSYPFSGSWFRQQFARDVDQGVYNATAALLGRTDLMLEYSQPVAHPSEPPRARPSIWISAVGNDALFPLTFISDYSAGRYVYESPTVEQVAPLYIPNQQGTLSVLLLGLGLVALLLALGYFRCYHAPPDEDLHYPWRLFRFFQAQADDPSTPSDSSHGDRRSLYVLTMFLPMTLAYPFLITIHFVQLRDGNRAEQLLGGAAWWMRVLHLNRHIGVYEGLTWRVLGIGLVAVLCLLAMLLVMLDVSFTSSSLGRRLRRIVAGLAQRRRWLFRAVAILLGLLLAFLLFQSFVRLVNYLQWNFNNMVFLRRAAHPAYGLSPITPLCILVGGLLLWGYSGLQRLRLGVRPSNELVHLVRELQTESALVDELKAIASLVAPPHPLAQGATLLLGMVLLASVYSDMTSLERYPLNLTFRVLFALLSAGMLFAAYRSLRLWLTFREFLDSLAHHPIAMALDRMPEALARSIGSLFLESLPEQARIEAEHSHLRLLQNHLRQIDIETELQGLPASQAEMLRTHFTALRSSNLYTEEAEPAAYSNTFALLLVKLLRDCWHSRPLTAALMTADATAPQRSTAEVYARALPPGLIVWLRLAEEFIAIRVVAYIYRLFPYLRNTLLLLTGGLLVLLAALVSYPFQPQHFLMLCMWAMILGGVGLAVMIVVQMNRCEVLSRVAKIEPGKLTFDRHFLSRVVVYGLLPLLSLLASQFPQVRGFAFSWLETILKTLK
ncbi:MAG: hypothetical protein JNJ46_24970 [Myxococcales bacterium]|nr:hypothetical protein [Myxococcales bacterium]